MIYLNLLLAGFLSVSVSGNKYSELVHNQLELAGQIEGLDEKHGSLRKLGVMPLHTNFSMFEGEWYDCLHTTLMTFNGEPADKHIIEQVGCDLGQLGSITKVGEHSQTLMFDIYLLNHCWFHDLGGEGQEKCPDDRLPNDSRGDGNVKVKYSFKGIGSFAEADKIEFFADHTYLQDKDGNWVASADRAKIENMDTMVCRKYWEGIVCDWRINEFRTSSTWKEACLIKRKNKKGKEIERCYKAMTETRCVKRNGSWGKTMECKNVVSQPNGFVYDSFGSYYLVQNVSDCTVTCPTKSPTASPVKAPVAVWGCYRGGKCGENAHGCCDCTIKSEQDCAKTGEEWTVKPIWSKGCKGICKED